jgi:hypothetical protein
MASVLGHAIQLRLLLYLFKATFDDYFFNQISNGFNPAKFSRELKDV